VKELGVVKWNERAGLRITADSGQDGAGNQRMRGTIDHQAFHEAKGWVRFVGTMAANRGALGRSLMDISPTPVG
jgi:hypothetical protein